MTDVQLRGFYCFSSFLLSTLIYCSERMIMHSVIMAETIFRTIGFSQMFEKQLKIQ